LGGLLVQFVTLLPSCKYRPKPETLELGPLIITLVCDSTHVERIWWNGILVKEIRPLGMGIWVLCLFYYSLLLETSIWMRWQVCNYLLSGGLKPLNALDHWEPLSFQFVMNKEQNGRNCEHTCWHVFDNPISGKMHNLRYVGPPLMSLKLLKEFLNARPKMWVLHWRHSSYSRNSFSVFFRKWDFPGLGHFIVSNMRLLLLSQ